MGCLELCSIRRKFLYPQHRTCNISNVSNPKRQADRRSTVRTPQTAQRPHDVEINPRVAEKIIFAEKVLKCRNHFFAQSLTRTRNGRAVSSVFVLYLEDEPQLSCISQAPQVPLVREMSHSEKCVRYLLYFVVPTGKITLSRPGILASCERSVGGV